MVISLSADTVKDYRKEVTNDVIIFQTMYAPAMFKQGIYDDFEKTNQKIIIQTIMARKISELDLVTLIYLDYKYQVITRYRPSTKFLHLLDKKESKK